MAELNRQDLFSDDLLQAPLVLAKNLEVAVEAAKELAKTLQAQQENIKAADTIAKVSKETKTLTDEQKELEKIQKAIATAQAKNNEEYQKAAGELDNIKEAQKKANAEAKLSKQINEQQAGSIKKVELELKKNRQAYEALSKSERENSKVGKDLLKTIQDQDKELKGLKSSIGQNQLEVGNYTDSIRQALGPLGNFTGGLGAVGGGLATAATGMKGAAAGANVFRVALMAIPLFAVIGAITSLVAYFQKTEDGALKLKVIMAGVSAVFDTLLDYVIGLGRSLSELSLDKVKQGFKDFGDAIKQYVLGRIEILLEGISGIGSAIKLLFAGEFTEAAKTAGEAFVNIQRGINPIAMLIEASVDAADALGKVASDAFKDISSRVKDNIRLQQLDNQLMLDRRAFMIEEAKLQALIAEERDKAADATLTDVERLEALRKAEDAMFKLNTARIGLKEREISIANQRAALFENDIAANDKLAELDRERIDIQTQFFSEKRRLTSSISSLEEKIRTDAEKAAEQARLKEIEALKEVGQVRLTALQENLNKEVALIRQAAIDGNKTREQAEKEIAALLKSQTDELIQEQIDGINRVLESDKLSKEERAKLAIELAKLEADLQKALFDQIGGGQDALVDETQATLEKIKEIYDQFAQSITGIFKSLSESRISGIDAEIAKVDAQAERELFLAGNNEEAKQRIIAITEVKRQQLEQKRKQEQQKQARLEKAAALVSAGINIALAYTKALAQGGLILGLPQATIILALGAAQIAAIAAQPIPQFAEGGIAPGGLAIVGEQGRELMKSPSGKVSLTPSIPTMMNIAKGTEIIPHNETMKMMALNGLLPNKITSDNAILWAEINDLKETIKEYDQRIVNAIYDNGGDVITQGSLIYKVKKKQDGSRTMIRKKSLS
jgi:hypothetical protein